MFDGNFEKDLKEGVGYFHYTDRRVYCGQYRNDCEEGVGEYINADGECTMGSVNQKKLSMISDKLYKICSQLKPLGVTYD